MSNWHHIYAVHPKEGATCFVKGILEAVVLCRPNEYWIEGYWCDYRNACYSIRQYPKWIYAEEFLEIMEEE